MTLCTVPKRGPQRTVPKNHELAFLRASLPSELREGLNQILKTLDRHEAAHGSHHKRIGCDPQSCPHPRPLRDAKDRNQIDTAPAAADECRQLAPTSQVE